MASGFIRYQWAKTLKTPPCLGRSEYAFFFGHVWWFVRFWILWKQYFQLCHLAKLLDMIGRPLWRGSNWQRWLKWILYRMRSVVIGTESKSGCWYWHLWWYNLYLGASWNRLCHGQRPKRGLQMPRMNTTCALLGEKYGAAQPDIRMLYPPAHPVSNSCARRTVKLETVPRVTSVCSAAHVAHRSSPWHSLKKPISTNNQSM